MNLPLQINEALGRIQHGWCTVEKAQALAAAVVSLRPECVVEIGIYSGRSFIPMALACKHLRYGRAIGIDPFDVKAAVEGEDVQHKEWWEKINYNQVEQDFLEQVYEHELQDWVDLRKMRSDEVEPPEEIGVLHVDGSHTEQALRDVERFAPQVIQGGFVFLDDIAWTSGAVSKSIEFLRMLGFVERRRLQGREDETGFENDWASFQRVCGVKPDRSKMVTMALMP